MKKIWMLLAVVAVSAMVVSCGPEAKAKRWGKQEAKLDNKVQKYYKKLTDKEKETFMKAYKDAYDKHHKSE